jgi:hypothetical protein
MLTTGVDLASQDARTAACVIDWSADRAVIAELTVGVDDAAITDLITASEKTGIDAPLGWPVAFAEAVALHSRTGSWPPAYVHTDNTAFRYRRTDLRVWSTTGSAPPLSVSTDRIAIPAMRAAAVLSRLPVRVPLDGTGAVVEAYPAAALRRWGMASRGYKGQGGAAVRASLVDVLVTTSSSWLDLRDSEVQLCKSIDDAFDALIAALIARAAGLGLVDPIPDEDREMARREGWISVPNAGSLGLLTGP